MTDVQSESNWSKRYSIVAPCYNEGATVLMFLDELLSKLKLLPFEFIVTIVDDSSINETPQLLKNYECDIDNVRLDILYLSYNQGHQGAIKKGLHHANQHHDTDYVIVLDSDGEDDPDAIASLVQLSPEHDIVFVARGKRKESAKFKVFYTLYKLLFRLITGKSVNFGNYSMISERVLREVVRTNFIHYSAYLSKTRFQKHIIKFDRRKRLDGVSKMSFNSLVLHGLKSFIEYSEDLFFVFLKLFLLVVVTILGTMIFVLYQKFIAHTAIPGWTSTLLLSLLIIALLSIGFFVLGLMMLYSLKKMESLANKNTN